MQIPPNEAAFLETVSKALGHDPDTLEQRKEQLWPQTPTTAHTKACEKIHARKAEDFDALVDRLRQETGPLNIALHCCESTSQASQTVADILINSDPEFSTRKEVVKWDHPLINALALEKALEGTEIQVHTAAFTDAENQEQQRADIRKKTEASFAGITSADHCLAQTATLVMKSRPKEPRSVSLVPSIHIAVIKKEQILENLKELYALLNCAPGDEKIPHHMVLVSGPSKTGDIELVMVHGAHGPRALHLVII